MKKYLVDIWDENTYKKIFTANNKEEAEEMARKEMNDGIEVGENNWNTGSNADCGVTDVEEIK